MNRLAVFFVFCLLALKLMNTAHAVQVNQQFKHQQITSLYYSTLPHTVVQAQQLKHSQWQVLTDELLNLGLSHDPVWIKFTIKNTEPQLFSALLTLDNPLIERAEIYHFKQQSLLSSYIIGDAFPIASREIKSESFVVKLNLPANSETVVFAKLTNQAGVRAPLHLWHPDAYLVYKSKVNSINGLLIGFVLSMAITHLILFGFSQKQYFAYAGALTLTLWCFLFYITGYGFRYIHPNIPSIQQVIIPLLLMLSALLFYPLEKLICCPKRLRWQKTKKVLVIIFALFTSIVWLLPVKIVSITALTLSPVLVLTYLVTTAFCIKDQAGNSSPAKAFLIALLCYFVVLIYFIAIVFGVYAFPRTSIIFVFICFLTCVSCLSYAAIKLFILQRDEQVTAQQAVIAESAAQDQLLKERIELQEAAQQELESQVNERTFELQVTLRELEEKNRELEQLNIEDALTGVKNRRFFDKKLVMELRRSRREQTELSLIMLDIDHFKNVNDNFGHLAGDVVIQNVATIIQNIIRRPLDEVARYGGEEFVILLPSTPLSGALEIAERIRSAIANEQVQSNEHNITVTISAGVYTCIASDIKHPENFTNNADKALYHAKQNGRNQVVSFPIEK